VRGDNLFLLIDQNGRIESEAQGERHIRLLAPLAFLSSRIIAATQTPETNAQDTHRTSAKESAEAVDFVPVSA
jgi:hypothetical protein